MPSALAERVAPAYLSLPPRAGSYGDIAVDLAAVCGLELDEHQVLTIDALQSIDQDGKWAMLEGCLVEPRQNGKSDGVLLPIALATAVFVPDSLIVWSAHRYKTSHEAFLAMLKLLGPEEDPTELGKLVAKRSFSTGDEGFQFQNGSRIVFVARSAASGRGLSGDLVILDEALFLTAAMMGALFPTLSARPNPLVLYASSAGLASSVILADVRDRGRAGGDPSLAYVEYCAPEGGCEAKDCDHAKTAVGCAADNPANWQAANYATVAGRMTLSYIAAERRAMPVAEFLRERMGWWDEIGSGGMFRLPSWWRRQDPDTVAGPRLVLAAHVSLDRQWAAVAVASQRMDKRLHVELIRHEPGTDWLLPYLTLRVEKWRPRAVAIASGMAAGTLVKDLEQLRAFTPLNTTETRRACAYFYDLVSAADSPLAVRPHPDLDAAVEVARRSSSKGEWVFAADEGVDLSPIYAVALAAHAARRRAPRTDEELLGSAR